MPPHNRGRSSRGGGRRRGRGGHPEGRGGHPSNGSRGPSVSGQPNVSTERTPEELQAKEDYMSWKNLLRKPPKHGDWQTVRSLWNGALQILGSGNKDWQQRLPRDLVDEEQLEGYKHIRHLLELRPEATGNSRFIELSGPFLEAATHPALLDCLSVDIYVGDIYNFISGSGGTRIVPFSQSLSLTLWEELPKSWDMKTFDTILFAMVTSLREVVRRNQKALFHEDLPGLMDRLKDISDRLDPKSTLVQSATRRVTEIQRMIQRARGLLVKDIDQQTKARDTLTYQLDIKVPGDRHDNDNMDITEVKILPTEEEIRSVHPEFLPSTDIRQLHFSQGVERLLDTHFRLLRHDIFGELKSILGAQLRACEIGPQQAQSPRSSSGNLNAVFYNNACVQWLAFTKRRGLEAQISFPQPDHLQKKSVFERKLWWEDSKRLQEGSLLCFLSSIDGVGSLLFFTVSQRLTDPEERYGLASSGHFATIISTLASGIDRGQVVSLMKLTHLERDQSVLIEFPGILLGTFVPTLENLQHMQKVSHLPFEDWIVPDVEYDPVGKTEELQVPPPLYARADSFAFDLKPILKDPTDALSLRPGSGSHDILPKLEQSTTLDRGQCQALIGALTSEFTLIQGPPGTGKSYLGLQIMRVLIANKEAANIGPILVVCYTNHALDQFLEHLMASGIKKVIRIGGQSTSPVLKGKNLRLIAQSEGKTGGERHLVGCLYGSMEAQEGPVTSRLKLLRGLQTSSWEALSSHLRLNYPKIHSQFNCTDKDGFTRVGRVQPFDLWKTGKGENLQQLNSAAGDLTTILSTARNNAYQLALADRKVFVDHITSEIRTITFNEAFDGIKEDYRLRQQIANVHDEIDRRVLETADVIGVTTSGLAKRISVLRHLNAKVVICEEAGEVLEAHMLSALVPSVQHLIQIGDHQQLRPQINNFNLSGESQQGRLYRLDRSQFERLAIGDHNKPPFPVAQLNVQRRMRPEISVLIRATLYGRLVDHENTKSLPDVVGMRKNVFWYDHTHPEDGSRSEANQTSKSNAWEAKMVHGLVRHIVRQGVYSSKDIAVLTPYVGQLQKLRAAMRMDFEIVLSDRDEETLIKDGFPDEKPSSNFYNQGAGPVLEKKAMSDLLRIATVDNFQGEEAKIIIVSLVRSNNRKEVGFLKTPNRINVLLSRAQHGMYLIGNASTYANIPMWSQVIGILRENRSIGNAIALCCSRHTETELSVSKPEDFAIVSPEDDSLIAAISVWRNAIPTPCIRSSDALKLVNGSSTPAVIAAQRTVAIPAVGATPRS
ncbi:MAG: hypothetical protein M1819_000633 [Sarea resinae]|nr:MAG: hypothetical protein M1819_000633 [Sarea resinae]